MVAWDVWNTLTLVISPPVLFLLNIQNVNVFTQHWNQLLRQTPIARRYSFQLNKPRYILTYISIYIYVCLSLISFRSKEKCLWGIKMWLHVHPFWWNKFWLRKYRSNSANIFYCSMYFFFRFFCMWFTNAHIFRSWLEAKMLFLTALDVLEQIKCKHNKK